MLLFLGHFHTGKKKKKKGTNSRAERDVLREGGGLGDEGCRDTGEWGHKKKISVHHGNMFFLLLFLSRCRVSYLMGASF